MYKKTFKIKLIDPLVISAKDKTETSLNCLDYIPGNVFLGIIAGSLYKTDSLEEKNKTLDLFHNGKVRFGNAYLSINSKQSLPIPADWYAYKGKKLNEGIEFYHLLKDIDWEQFSNEEKQIKQVRNGYFIYDDRKIIIKSPQKGVVLKSAYNSDRRSAKAEQMYLYEYLEAGQEFIFEISSEIEDYLNEIQGLLIGKKHITKSKSAEFGGVEISVLEDYNYECRSKNSSENTYIVYAKSNLAFINEYGEMTWQPTAEDLGFTGGTIDYEHSQLWFDHFHLRNGKRRTYDADRLIIKKGSVFVIKGGTPDINTINKGVGVFLSEGYGQICINPDFMSGIENSNIKYEDNETNNNTESKTISSNFNNLIKERYEKEKQIEEIYNEVSKFMSKSFVDNIRSSQWGGIRSLIYQARQSENPNKELYKLIFDKETGYIYHGKMEEKWRGQIRRKLKEFLNLFSTDEEGKEVEATSISDENIDKLLLLTIEIAKVKKS